MRKQISHLASNLLSNDEIALAERLYSLFKAKKMEQARVLLKQILPKYWKEENGRQFTLSPRGVYRTLYYLDKPHSFARSPRHMISLMGDHLACLLENLAGISEEIPPSRMSLGVLINSKQMKVLLPTELSSSLLEFNQVYVYAKHMSANPFLEEQLDRRTFTTHEAILCLIIMRYLSMKLSDLLKKNNKPLEAEWKQISPEWLTWNNKTYPL